MHKHWFDTRLHKNNFCTTHLITFWVCCELRDQKNKQILKHCCITFSERKIAMITNNKATFKTSFIILLCFKNWNLEFKCFKWARCWCCCCYTRRMKHTTDIFGALYFCFLSQTSSLSLTLSLSLSLALSH